MMVKRFFTVKSKATNLVNSILHGSNEPFNDSFSKHLTRGKGKLIHELCIHDVKPEAMDDYKSLTKSLYNQISKDSAVPCELFGSFTTEIGELDQAVHIWEYKNYQGWDDTKELVATGDYQKLLAEMKPMLRSRRNQIILEFAFWHAIKPTDHNHIYEMRSYRLKPGRMLEWEAGW